LLEAEETAHIQGDKSADGQSHQQQNQKLTGTHEKTPKADVPAGA
jgi:hypothetical protein